MDMPTWLELLMLNLKGAQDKAQPPCGSAAQLSADFAGLRGVQFPRVLIWGYSKALTSLLEFI